MGVIDDVLGQLIDQSLIDQEAARLQLDVSDDVIRDDILADPMFKGPNGAFDRGAFNALLAANHMTEGQYVEQMRERHPAQGSDARGDRRGCRRRRRWSTGSINTAMKSGSPTSWRCPTPAPAMSGSRPSAELSKFYDAHQDLFRAPEYRGFTMASLTPSDIARKIEVPEDRLKKEYDQRQDEFVLPERRDVQQILAPSEGQAKAAEAALAAGKDLKEVATTIAGQDPATIDLGLMARAEMPQALAEVAFSLPLDKPSRRQNRRSAGTFCGSSRSSRRRRRRLTKQRRNYRPPSPTTKPPITSTRSPITSRTRWRAAPTSRRPPPSSACRKPSLPRSTSMATVATASLWHCRFRRPRC